MARMTLKQSYLEGNFKYCFLVFQILGLQFFSVQSLRSEKNLSVIKKWPSVGFCSYFLLLFVVVSVQNLAGVFLLQDSFNNDSMVKQMVNNFMRFGTTGIFTLSAMLLLILSFNSTQNQKSIFLNLISISEQFESLLKIRIDYKKLAKIMFTKLIVLLLFYIVIYIILLQLEMLTNSGFERYLNWVGFTIVRIVYSGKLFVFYVDMITHHLVHLENTLQEIHATKFYQTISVERDFFVSVKSSAKYYDGIYKKLTHVKNIYGLLWETSIKVNDSMGKILLTYIIIVVVSVTGAGYKTFVIIATHQPIINAVGEKFFLAVKFKVLSY